MINTNTRKDYTKHSNIPG